MAWVLASTSPRRKELLAQAGFSHLDFSFQLVAPNIDETPLLTETAEQYVCRLALEKAQAGLVLSGHVVKPQVLGSDTIVVLNGLILGKPTDLNDAKRMLALLSGQTHEVMTAVALTDGEHTFNRLCRTQVSFCELSAADIDAYVASGEPMDKAGAYGIQALGGCFVKSITGSYSAVVGLPLVETRELLACMMQQT
ncbi:MULTISPECIES: nucleoside triphosphate pyrophosphatase [unclassified Shewanella]|jgi:septum formation protein|uniref:Maf family protein n=1 Tax=unclassified Shewanella TaxID=196818 RepID=UPI000C32630F|nr:MULTISPECIES: nucleoside triphosphate pyrophosphatase [unclassified Shewanella]MBB1362376.1 septum formation inhibitor Maf [Shewanella sp. SR44-4]MBO1896574.1 septum formation inhibitor Maf [Shewanella sp. BF02_Schw]PKH29550.1 septum formation inhibitor Maf [Shewanella sp. ALD9]QHS15106.1 septum formation inhibitor Maf [Shewanella sp. Arc9-LZ]|tara:strand:+ start:148 stop:735 length:588 start_codon:yes stop_codon:yes gene_type:complete